MENELDYPDDDVKDTDMRCPLCNGALNFDNLGVYCSCGYKERLED